MKAIASGAASPRIPGIGAFVFTSLVAGKSFLPGEWLEQQTYRNLAQSDISAIVQDTLLNGSAVYGEDYAK